MKRPEGFDRTPVKRPAPPEAPAGRREAAAPAERQEAAAPAGRKGAAAPADRSRPVGTTRAAEPGLPADPAGAAEPGRPAEPARPAEPRDPAFLTVPDASADEARERARAARRLARRAKAARRAVERTEVRRFTRRSRHRRAAWITAGAVVVVLVGSVTISVFSPLLSLQTVRVEGTSRVDRAAVQKSLDQQVGKPLALIDFAAVKTDLSNFPLIESYVTETMPPHTLVVRITEREPIASVKVGKTYELVDPAGVIIQTSTKQPANYPIVDLKGQALDGKVFRSTAEVLLSLPAQLRTTVKTVSASTADDVTFTLTTGEQVVWGSADESARKAQLLAGLIKDHKARNPTQSVVYDVSAPDNGIIRTK